MKMRLPKLCGRESGKSAHPRWQDWTWSRSGSWQDSRAGEVLRHGIEGGLGVLIILLLVSFWWPHTHTHDPAAAAHTSDPTVTRPVNMGSTIAAAHLFGQVAAQSKVATAPIAPSITIEGIVYASDPANSQAVLTINGKTNVYKVGEALPGGEKVSVIDPGGIQLIENGNVRHLAMKQYGTADSEGPAAYAAMLRGTGFNTSVASAAPIKDLNTTSAASEQSLMSSLPPVPHAIAVPRTPIVRVSATATPLEQLRSLRAQLIR